MKQKKLSDRQQDMMRSVLMKDSPYTLYIEGTVLCHRGADYDVKDATGQIFKVGVNRRLHPVVGDHVGIGVSIDGKTRLLSITPRMNELARFESMIRQPIAANIDYACVVLAAKPVPWAEMIAQYVTYLKILKINPCIIVNKTDLSGLADDINDRLAYLKTAIDLPIFYGSAHQGPLVSELKTFLSGSRAIFIGPSGVGKSSLIQGFLPDEAFKVGSLSGSDKGRHTTSVTRLYDIENNIQLIDAPGVRQCSLGKINRAELQKGFEDLQLLGCRFKNCDHIHSAGCAVLMKIEGDLALKQRYHDYLFLGQKFIEI